VVQKVLADLKCSEKPALLVFNKADLLPAAGEAEVEFPSRSALLISAEKRQNIDRLREALLAEVRKAHLKIFPNWLEPVVYSGLPGEA
jgi:GTP-binding protein HflX